MELSICLVIIMDLIETVSKPHFGQSFFSIACGFLEPGDFGLSSDVFILSYIYRAAMPGKLKESFLRLLESVI